MKRIITTLAATALSLGVISCSSESSVVGTQGMTKFISVEPGLNTEQLQQVATRHCKGESRCYLHIWDNPAKAARSFPMTDAQLESKLATYQRNPSSGRDLLIVGGITVGTEGIAPKPTPPVISKRMPSNKGWCDSLVDSYLDIRAEIQGMGLDSELSSAADGDAYQAWQDVAQSSGCIN